MCGDRNHLQGYPHGQHIYLENPKCRLMYPLKDTSPVIARETGVCVCVCVCMHGGRGKGSFPFIYLFVLANLLVY